MDVKALKLEKLVCLMVVSATVWPAMRAQAQTLHVLRPISNAIVRETVPVRIAPGDLPSEGYVGVSIDGQFRTARVLPANKHDAVYDWDTKASYATADDPNGKKFVADGPHTLNIKLYDTSGKSLGERTITVKVANKINVPTQGIKLAYRWRPDLQQRYTRRTEADTVADGAAGTNQTLQSSIIRFTRTVEDTTGGNYLIRDRILPGGVLLNHNQPQSLDTLYNIKSKYRTVDTRGNILGSMAPLSMGDHFGFSIPVLSARRVSVGDTWQSPVEVALDWASTKPIKIDAESRLEGFEWQSGYPAAKIRETYTGPMTFVPMNATAGVSQRFMPGISQSAGTANSSNGSIVFPTVNYERIVYFAYNSGRLIRTETTLTLTVDNSQLTGLGFAGGATGSGFAFGSPSGSYPVPGGNYPTPDGAENPMSLPPGGPPLPGSYAGGPPGGFTPPGAYAGAGGLPSGAYAGGPPNGYGGNFAPAAPQSTTTNLKMTDITSQS